MKSFGTAKASLLIQKKKQNNQQPPDPWSLVLGLCGVICGLRFFEFFLQRDILYIAAREKNTQY